MRIRSIFSLGDIRQSISRRCVLISFGALAGLACLAAAHPALADPRRTPGVRSIRLVDHDEGVKTLYHVILDQRFETAELDTLANRIRWAAPKTEMTSILFFLRGMRPGDGAWATSDFNPALGSFEIEINEAVTSSNPPAPDLAR